jgi:hypothetical protein
MSTSTLSHGARNQRSELVTLDALRRLPEPPALGRLHKPVPHHVLVSALHEELSRRHYTIEREQLALSRTSAALFGVMDLRIAGAEGLAAHGLAFGFRNAIDQQFGIRAVAGQRVFVCDNLRLSGDLIAISRKNTTRLDLGDALALGVDKFTAHSAALEIQVARLEATTVTDGEAKRIVYDLFAARILPVRLFDDVHRFYFQPGAEMTDCAPRTLAGLHNACTRAARDLSPARGFTASNALGQHFHLGAELPVIDTIAVPERPID